MYNLIFNVRSQLNVFTRKDINSQDGYSWIVYDTRTFDNELETALRLINVLDKRNEAMSCYAIC